MDSIVQGLQDRLRAAAADRRPLRIRGGGSKDFFGDSLQGELLDMAPLTGIVAYEPSELVVTVHAGTPLAELEATLAQHGQFLAFEPPHFGTAATVGGMVSAGWSGPARAAAGAARDYVLGLDMLNGQGERLRFGGQVMKNVAGYDVSRLLCGAWGTLGVVLEVSLKVLPQRVAEACLVFAMDQAQALRQLNAWSGKPLPLNASCWWPEDGAAGRLVVRLRGAQAAVQEACMGMGGVRADDALDWSQVREQTLPAFARAPSQCLWRLSVPDTTGVLGLPQGAELALVEWHGALRWVRAPAHLADALRTVAAQAGGSAMLFRRAADGSAASVPVMHPVSAPLQRIQQALKQRFDPAGIFNPGRMSGGF